MTLSRRVAILQIVAAFMMTGGVAQTFASERGRAHAGGAVTVAARYTGPGTVDAKHRLWVWVFDTPDVGSTAVPIASASQSANGEPVTIDGLEAGRVWIVVGYDSRGGSDGSTRPPSGTPIGIYGVPEGPPAAVSPAERPLVTLAFDDSLRIP